MGKSWWDEDDDNAVLGVGVLMGFFLCLEVGCFGTAQMVLMMTLLRILRMMLMMIKSCK